jgi:hypothetical protein
MTRGGQEKLHAGEQAASSHPAYAASSRAGCGEQIDCGSSHADCGACSTGGQCELHQRLRPRARTRATAARLGASAWADNSSSVPAMAIYEQPAAAAGSTEAKACMQWAPRRWKRRLTRAQFGSFLHFSNLA